MEQTTKTQFKIDLFQTARIHTEQFIEEFATEDEARARAQEICAEKGIDPDFEITAVESEPVSVDTTPEATAEVAPVEAAPVEAAPVDTTVAQQ